MSTFNPLFDPAVFDPAIFDTAHRFPNRTYCFNSATRKQKLKDLDPEQILAIKEYLVSRVQSETV
jgi:hypothetical protein